MREIPVFYEWLNEITDEIAEKAYDLNIHLWQARGIRDDAPPEIKKAFQEFLDEEEYYRHNAFETRPIC